MHIIYKMNKNIARYFTLTLTAKTSLIFILVFASIIVFDSTIVKFTSYSGVELTSQTNTTIFIIFSIIFGMTSIVLVNSMRKMTMVSGNASGAVLRRVGHFHRIISAIQIMTFGIILVIIIQMLIQNKYSLILLKAQVYISHISALIFLPSLVFLFTGWLIKSKRNYVIILYTISFSVASVNLVVSLLYLQSYFAISGLPDVDSYSINSYVTNQPGSSVTESLYPVFDALALASFLLMWIATAIFLSQYRHKMGKIKYFSFMAIPLVYYIFPLQGYFGDIFFNMLQSSPISYSIIYIIIFSATKQVGAVLFSLAFWAASTLVYDNRVRRSLLISSIGMAILFGTFEITPLQYHVYPPYGFITQAFIPLGTYLLFVAIFSSAKVIARDSKVRKEFYKSAESQLSLLKTIGVSEMEKELEQQAKLVYRVSRIAENENELESEHQRIEEENVKEILHDVLNELYYSKGKKEIHHDEGNR